MDRSYQLDNMCHYFRKWRRNVVDLHLICHDSLEGKALHICEKLLRFRLYHNVVIRIAPPINMKNKINFGHRIELSREVETFEMRWDQKPTKRPTEEGSCWRSFKTWIELFIRLGLSVFNGWDWVHFNFWKNILNLGLIVFTGTWIKCFKTWIECVLRMGFSESYDLDYVFLKTWIKSLSCLGFRVLRPGRILCQDWDPVSFKTWIKYFLNLDWVF